MMQQQSIHNLALIDLTEAIIGSCFEVINELGTGFAEKVYKRALCTILRQRGFIVDVEHPYEICFRGELIGKYFADIVVNKAVIVELKCCCVLLPDHQAQVINYLKASKLNVGLLVNFGNYKLEFKRLHG